MQIIGKGKPQRGDENLILKLKDDIRQNIRLQAELALGTPVLAAVKKRMENAYSLENGNGNENNNTISKKCKRDTDWYSNWYSEW